ncbi:16023_t:CDS:2 [Acaulospora colombiana]|uniref:16023_t:CDS:1 n=1 Tax=Acaulospora colombiana TaxID=27376 RepID=A0ACA9L2G8_9GLOM|nr:16023_t:CDS:2 [Acaulospora colombiana]
MSQSINETILRENVNPCTSSNQQFTVSPSTSTKKSIFSRKPQSQKILTTQMIQLDESDPDYISIKEGFGINLNSTRANILAIMKLQMPTKLEKAHEKYKKKMTKKLGMDAEEFTHKMHHGTKSSAGCDLRRFIMNFEAGESGFGNVEYDPTFCKENCGVCGIAQCGNKRKYARTKSLFKRNRMWFAKDPSVSLGFCNYGYKDTIKGMFIVDVIHKRDEHIIITTKERATLPRYLIIFEVPVNPFSYED